MNFKEEIDELLKNTSIILNKNNLYLVGGCVRDLVYNKLFNENKKINDFDFIVINYKEEELLNLGFEKVGASFPVFLDPIDKNEYALPRKEIKTGIGYKEFSFIIDNVSIEDDLGRRDITINSMALNLINGELIDSYNGLKDLVYKRISYVSKESFIEDPLRTLRVCRFAATFDSTISNETKEAILELVKNEIELESLSKERLILELNKSLKISKLHSFFEHIQSLSLNELLYPYIKTILNNDINIFNKIDNTIIKNNEILLGYLLSSLSDKNEIKYYGENYKFSSETINIALFLNTNKTILENIHTLDNKIIFDFLLKNPSIRHENNHLMNVCQYMFDNKLLNIDIEKLKKCVEVLKTINVEDFVNGLDNKKDIGNKIKTYLEESFLEKIKDVDIPLKERYITR